MIEGYFGDGKQLFFEVEYLFDQVEQFIGSERQNTDDMTLVVLQIV
ncbi:MAG: hypothetical protein HCA25_13545 [Dolichospermum sp. DET50]|jgi:hypothetical protein|nr:hypothetical protein [Dolichospermum sp. DET66]MBS3033262.1 hypothetical protein [Dolichospermum sp. DET67]MBS3038466.1 hypothetical protein [Dolichospermum sp. DET50]QSX70345.1 MAG: hypothetical protein EZY12_12795 [Dolichospermum sp. DET69]